MPTDPDLDLPHVDLFKRRAAGWYPDDVDPTAERWWNGTQWTTHTRPAGSVPDEADLTGRAPRDWSAPDDHAVATVDRADPSVGVARGFDPHCPDPLDVPPGWYPDPQGFPMLRWWDGWGWTDRTGPLPPPPMVAARGKSVGVAFVLTFFFGPFGMLYSTVTGAVVMLSIQFLFGFVLFGLAWFLLWPIGWLASIIWGVVAASNAPARVGPWR